MLVYLGTVESESDRQKFEAICETFRDRMLYAANDVLRGEWAAGFVLAHIRKPCPGPCRSRNFLKSYREAGHPVEKQEARFFWVLKKFTFWTYLPASGVV